MPHARSDVSMRHSAFGHAQRGTRHAPCASRHAPNQGCADSTTASLSITVRWACSLTILHARRSNGSLPPRGLIPSINVPLNTIYKIPLNNVFTGARAGFLCVGTVFNSVQTPGFPKRNGVSVLQTSHGLKFGGSGQSLNLKR